MHALFFSCYHFDLHRVQGIGVGEDVHNYKAILGCMGAPFSVCIEPCSPAISGLLWENSTKIHRKKVTLCFNRFWLVYLSADWIATLVLTTLLRVDNTLKNELIVFWTPFILCHLGSPHNITAYSLEDNDLWLRHFIGLVFQVGEAIYIYVEFLSELNFALHAMAVPIFVAGIIKYGERVWALRCASDKELVNSFFSIPDNKIDEGGKNVRIGLSKEKINTLFKHKGVVPEVDFLRQAYSSYNIFNPLFTDVPLRLSKEFHDNRVYMESKSAEDAFKFVDVELSFVYDLFFTKNPIHYRNIKVSIALRSFCLASVICSLIAFTVVVVVKLDHLSIDIGITYLLLVGAISLDVYSILMHAVSTWAMILLPIPYKKVRKMYAQVVAYRLQCIKANSGIKMMAQHDLIKYSVRANPSSLTGAIKLFDTGNLLQKYGYTRWKPVDHDLKNSIYAHLQKQRGKCESFRLDKLEKLLNEKGEHVLSQKFKEMPGYEHDKFFRLLPRSDPTYFVRSIFLWHIATALTYYDDIDNHRAAGSFRNISKSLSDYMMYLALVRPGMLCKGFTDVINRKIYQEALGLLCTKRLRQFTRDLLQFVSYQNQSKFYQPLQDKVGALLEGARFALRLQRLAREMRWDVDEKWEMISEVWMEMMTHAASHCPWREHVQQLRHGGELLTHVALIMAHLGLSTKVGIDEYDEDSDDALPPFDV